jgi:hypothetical protein
MFRVALALIVGTLISCVLSQLLNTFTSGMIELERRFEKLILILIDGWINLFYLVLVYQVS